MKEWFDQFEACLRGSPASSDLIGAGTADADRAMGHYRYQYQAKQKEAVELTFPRLRKYLGEEWEMTWKTFHGQNDISPRSLDWYPEVFLNYFLSTTAPLWMKELARFEHRLDIHPWSHRTLSLKAELVPDEESKIIPGNHEIISFAAPVVDLFYERRAPVDSPQTVLLWQKESGVYFRLMQSWELDVFQALPLGVERALQYAPEDPEAVGEFFRWLGSSCLIQDLKRE